MHRDHLSSVRLITNASGLENERANYRPFGGQFPGLSQSKGYIGEKFDAETGLQYLHARWYDPALARFLTPDDWNPVIPGVGTNRYAYSFNDPINSSDASGHVCCGGDGPVGSKAEQAKKDAADKAVTQANASFAGGNGPVAYGSNYPGGAYGGDSWGDTNNGNGFAIGGGVVSGHDIHMAFHDAIYHGGGSGSGGSGGDLGGAYNGQVGVGTAKAINQLTAFLNAKTANLLVRAWYLNAPSVLGGYVVQIVNRWIVVGGQRINRPTPYTEAFEVPPSGQFTIPPGDQFFNGKGSLPKGSLKSIEGFATFYEGLSANTLKSYGFSTTSVREANGLLAAEGAYTFGQFPSSNTVNSGVFTTVIP
jgi:RHS repeat-associated protein